MTKKLYYEDGYRAHFLGRVMSCEPDKEKYIVVLDQTAFYPEGGGQMADNGTIDDAYVSHVFIKEGTIYHVVDQLLTVGKEVEGCIDFEKRFDLMQQHTGEHIISGLIHEQYGYNNVGFHMSNEYTTCDFDGELTKEQMLAIEVKANEAIYRNIAIKDTIYQAEEITDIAYRSKLDLKGEVRLVEVPYYDTCACCGTHVRTTGEIGMIKITGVERHRGGTRVTMLCGKRALNDYQKKQEIIAKAGQMLSAKSDAVISHLEKLQDELAMTKQKTVALTNQLFDYKSKTYITAEEAAIFVYEEDLAGDDLRRFCLLLTEQTDKNVLVVAGKGKNLKYALGSSKQDIREINKKLTAQFNGKGGGKSGLCQGNLIGNIDEIKSFFYTA